MRSILKFGAPLAAAALALSACGGTSSNNGAAGNGDSGKKNCNQKIAFFGALTGDAANLGINIQNGAKLAIDQYNEKNADCKVTLVSLDSQGDPAQAPGLAKRAIDDKDIIGIVGPSFSGESKAADPLFSEAGLVTITASATNPALGQQGWKSFFRVLGNDSSQGPAAAKYIKDTLGAKKVFVVDDASEYGKGLADIVRSSLGSSLAGSDSIQQKQTDFSPTVTKIRASGATAVYFGGYYAEAGLLKKQMVDAGVTATFLSDDGVKDDGFITAAGPKAAEGTVVTCPCLPPDKAGGTFYADYQKAFNAEPKTYGAEAFDAATILLDGIKSGITDRAKMLEFVKSYDKPGVTKQLKFDDHGEPSSVSVWAYKVQGGKFLSGEEIK